MDAYAEIGSALPRFDRYEATFKDNPEFQFVLAGVYSSILEFHQHAYEFFQRGGRLDPPFTSWEQTILVFPLRS